MKTKTFNLYSLWETKEEENQNELDQQIVEKSIGVVTKHTNNTEKSTLKHSHSHQPTS